MRISDWSSDVCSSDLATLQLSHQGFLQRADVRQSQKDASLLRSAIDIHVDLHRRHLLLRRPVAGACVAAQTPLGLRVEPAMAYGPYRNKRQRDGLGKRVAIRLHTGGRR